MSPVAEDLDADPVGCGHCARRSCSALCASWSSSPAARCGGTAGRSRRVSCRGGARERDRPDEPDVDARPIRGALMGVEEVIATFQTGTYTVIRTARGVFVNGKYQCRRRGRPTPSTSSTSSSPTRTTPTRPRPAARARTPPRSGRRARTTPSTTSSRTAATCTSARLAARALARGAAPPAKATPSSTAR